MEECIFCKIVNKEIKANVVYEDEKVMAFYDINPQAPFHVLLIPKKHISTLLDIEEDKILISEMMVKIKDIVEKIGISKSGFRTVINCGKDAGMDIFHLHIHILGGRRLSWPPG
ncbi:TPA: histidine triad nucleotide-binding protein [bacterium]|nr:histidine triad nucleotide-binding protein [bacterium]